MDTFQKGLKKMVKKKMRSMMKKVMAVVLVLTVLLQIQSILPVLAADYPIQPAPQKLRLNEASPDPVGYNQFDRYYADLEWDAVTYPAGAQGYLNFYLQEINKPYKPSKPVVANEKDVAGANTSIRYRDLNSGTVYYGYSKAFYTVAELNSTYTSPESPRSNMVKFMTDMVLEASSYGQKQIKIVWDDVWDAGRRIDYRLYVSENKEFSGTPPIYIRQENIGANGPVIVNEATGKLEYIFTVRDPGRVYYIKIMPDNVDPEMEKSPESKTVAASSFILAKTSKLSVNDYGTVWRLDWSPVVTGINSNQVKISYHIYRGNTEAIDIPQYMAATDDTSFFITVGVDEPSSYYIIKAIVTLDGQDLYPGISIESDRIILKEAEIPASPPMPELVSEFQNNAGDVILRYKDELKPNSATVLWRTPLKANGDIDTEIAYDIWLISDPNKIHQPDAGDLIISDLKLTQDMYVTGENPTDIKGCKFPIKNMTANSTYYFKMIAKKQFLEFDEEGQLVDISYSSVPAIKVIITPAAGPIDQPQTPTRPPLKIKRNPVTNKLMVTERTSVIQLKNKWYEKYENNQWVYKEPAQMVDANGVNVVNALEAGTLTDINFRIAQYDAGVTLNVGVMPYTEGMDYGDLYDEVANWRINVPITANDPYETAAVNPDGKKHNIDISIANLQPNTTYVLWVRAARLSANQLSEPSDPIIITTNPDIPIPVEKPTVPVFNYYNALDNYIDVGWNFRAGYHYTIKYGIKDDVQSASGTVAIVPADLVFTSYYRIKELDANTLYYFWIQAESVNEAGVKSQSEWSDSYLVKTLPLMPPSTPRGFGVKNTDNAITKDSITYEWIKESGMTYILEVASDIDYKDMKEYIVGDAASFKVDGLRSNYRYFARLYAEDTKKNLRSEPTQSITVRTLRSNDDYDSDQDVEDIITGDFVIKDPVIRNQTWYIAITGIHADRFIEHVQNDKTLDYQLDLSKPPLKATQLNVRISHRVFDALSSLKENLIISTVHHRITLRPDVFAVAKEHTALNKMGDYNFEISISFPALPSGMEAQNTMFSTPITRIALNAKGEGSTLPIHSFSRALLISYPYEDEDFYTQDKTQGYIYGDKATEWEAVEALARFNPDQEAGRVSFEAMQPGYYAVGEQGNNFYDDIQRHWASNSIKRVAQIHPLNSVVGRNFEPDRNATVADSVKFMLDVMDITYQGDYMKMALKANLVDSQDADFPNLSCTRENAISMAVRVYELKSKEVAQPSSEESLIFKDIGNVSKKYLERVKFASEINMTTSRFSDILGPQDSISRAEVMVLLEKVLAFAGELE